MKLLACFAEADATAARRAVRAIGNVPSIRSLTELPLRAGHACADLVAQAADTFDSCLVLWTKGLIEQLNVHALAQRLEDLQTFLVVARLGDDPAPAPAGARLILDLRPASAPGGIDTLATCLALDDRAVQTSGYPIRPGRSPGAIGGGRQTTLYVTSELWRLTIPVQVDFDEPVGVLLHRFVAAHGLPTRVPESGPVGVAVRYELAAGSRRLGRSTSWREHGAVEGAVLYLETELEAVGQGPSRVAADGRTYFRTDDVAFARKREVRALLRGLAPSR